jgi:hypothetical protein
VEGENKKIEIFSQRLFGWCKERETVDLGGLVVSVLATGPKVRGFDPDRGRWVFKGDKNP